MHFDNRINSEISKSLQLKSNFKLVVLLMLFCFPVIGQKRNADRIITKKADTLTVNILEVGLNEIKYQKTATDTIQTLAKDHISKVMYGNGEIEEFLNFKKSFEKLVPGNPDFRYYKMVLATPFQKSITQWSDQKLLSEQKRYKDISTTNLFLGVTSIIAGSALFSHGLWTIFDSNNSSAFMISGIFTGTLGIPLLAFRNKAKKKNKSIGMEIERRRFQQFPTLPYK